MAPNSTKMDGIDLLKREAMAKRNATILQAKRDYQTALREIAALRRKLSIRLPGRPRKRLPAGDPNLKATTVARQVLLEGKPMTLTELTIEVQRRGCRPLDHPRTVAHAIRTGLQHYRREFKRDREGRWTLS